LAGKLAAVSLSSSPKELFKSLVLSRSRCFEIVAETNRVRVSRPASLFHAPHLVGAPAERRQRLGVQDRPAVRVADLDLFAPPTVVPVDRVEGDDVRPAVRFRETVKLIAAYQAAATRLNKFLTWSARGSVQVVDTV
jgi:hypothetical protein